MIFFRGGGFSGNFWLEVCILFSISAIGWKSKNPEPIGRSGRIGATAIQTPSQILYLIPLWGESKKIPYKNQVKFLTRSLYRKELLGVYFNQVYFYTRKLYRKILYKLQVKNSPKIPPPKKNHKNISFLTQRVYNVMWCDVMWCDVMWCDVMWCDVMWCDIMWRDVMCCDIMVNVL